VITHKLKLLHAASVDGFADINVALGVQRHRVRVHEFTDLMSRAAKTAEDLPGGAVRDINFLVNLINDEHVLLARVAGEFDGGTRSHLHRIFPRSGGIRGNGSPNFKTERHVSLKIALGVEDLKAVHPPVAYINQSIIAHANAMDRRRGSFAHFFRRPVQRPLAQVVSALIKHHDAKIISAASLGMPIGDVNVAIMGIESDL